MLSKIHPHLFILGTVIFLIAAVFARKFDKTQLRRFRAFNIVYNIGVAATAAAMLARGVFQVLGTELSNGADKAITYAAGTAHAVTAIGVIIFILTLRKTAKN